MDRIDAFNRALFLQINADTNTPVWMIQLGIGTAKYLLYLIPVILFMIWIKGNHAQRNLALRAVFVMALSLGINQVIGAIWMHPRPFMINLGHTWMYHKANFSFPSNHMVIFASIGLTFLFCRARILGLIILIMSIAVAWARIFVGVHFPLDMVGAVLVVIMSYVSISVFWLGIGEKLTLLAESIYRKVFALPIKAGWFRH